MEFFWVSIAKCEHHIGVPTIQHLSVVIMQFNTQWFKYVNE